MSKKASGVVILTAGIGLGVYIPSLLIQRQLATMQIAADVEVLERYYMPDKQRAHLAHKAAFQENFNLSFNCKPNGSTR